MGGCRCSYKTCPNTTKTRDNLHFFHYPVKHKERCKTWIENAKKPQFYDLDEDQLRNKVVCETHFQDNYFPNMQKKRLLQGAVPTLDGDAVPEAPVAAPALPLTRLRSSNSIKVQDVKILPANDDGTIFMLDTNNLQTNYHQSERIESYIYTNNGLVLPIDKCDNSGDESNMNMSNAGSDIEDIFEAPRSKSVKREHETVDAKDFETVLFDPILSSSAAKSRAASSAAAPRATITTLRPVVAPSPPASSGSPTDDSLTRKYVDKINQHSKQIAHLKRLLKTKAAAPNRKLSNSVVLNDLNRKLPSSLYRLVNYNLTSKCDISEDDLEFFATIYNASPELYQIFSEKYKWKMPSSEVLLKAKNEGSE